MKQWMETRAVFDAVDRLRSAGRRGALATVIRVRGSAYRHEGAKLVVGDDDTVVGNISGGCLEQDVIEVARRVMQEERPTTRSWCGGADEVAAWDLGVGCEGEVEILVEPLRGTRAAEQRLLARAIPFAIVTSVDEASISRVVVSRDAVERVAGTPAVPDAVVVAARERLGRDGGCVLNVDGQRWIIESLEPPPRVVLISGADDAREVARVAASVGFNVTVVDRRPGWLAPDRFLSGVTLVHADAASLPTKITLVPSDLAIVMTHNFADDAAMLGALLDSPVGYIGVLGPRGRTVRLHTTLGRDPQRFDARVHAPVGLDIGTDGAEQVALSIVAELLAVRSGRQPRSLRERTRPIHALADGE